jgi:predicted amidohydrolase
LRVAVVQTNPRFGEVEANLDAVEALLEGTAADVWVLPELFATGYVFASRQELADLAEPLDGPTLCRVQAWARRYDAAVAAGWPEAAEGGVYNSAVILGPAGILAHYRKIHRFDRETLLFLPGDRPFPVVGWREARLGLMICFDWRFPEAMRTLALRGADLVLHPSNLVLPWCPEAMRYRALENHVFAATANRWGIEERAGQRLRFIGQSQVVGPSAERRGRLGEEADGVLVVEIDPSVARDKRVGPHNDLWSDRRPAFYLTEPGGGP